MEKSANVGVHSKSWREITVKEWTLNFKSLHRAVESFKECFILKPTVAVILEFFTFLTMTVYESAKNLYCMFEIDVRS